MIWFIIFWATPFFLCNYLDKKYDITSLFILTVQAHDEIKDEDVEKFVQMLKISYYIPILNIILMCAFIEIANRLG